MVRSKPLGGDLVEQETIRAVAFVVIGLVTALLVGMEVAANLRQERQRDAEAAEIQERSES